MSTKQASAREVIFHPVVETKETLESVLVLIRVPGFAPEHINARHESAHRRVRVSGRRPLGNNKWSRFDEVYPIPESVDVNRLRRMFEGETLTIVMPKKVISRVTPKDQAKPITEQAAAKPPTDATETKPEKAQEAIPPKSAAGVEERSTDQKGKDGVSQESKPTIDSQKQAEAEDQKMETSLPPKATDDSFSEKGQEGIPQKAAFTEDSKGQADEKVAESITKNGESQRFENQEERKDDGKSSESGKPTEQAEDSAEKERKGEKVVVKDSAEKEGKEEKAVVKDSAEKESKGEERKEYSAMVAESSVSKTPTEKEKKKQNIGKFGGVDELEKRKDATDTKGKGIKEVAASASQAVTRLAKRFNEEDKQKMIYMSAAVIVVAALGIYASCKLRSSARP